MATTDKEMEESEDDDVIEEKAWPSAYHAWILRVTVLQISPDNALNSAPDSAPGNPHNTADSASSSATDSAPGAPDSTSNTTQVEASSSSPPSSSPPPYALQPAPPWPVARDPVQTLSQRACMTWSLHLAWTWSRRAGRSRVLWEIEALLLPDSAGSLHKRAGFVR
ncbi:hypothetical protein BDR22DRAFT_889223 [Usnea florida]